MSAVLKINEELNGIELYFNSKPVQSVLTTLKSNGFRWSNFKKCWYTKQSQAALHIAQTLTNNTAEVIELAPAKTKETVKKAAKVKAAFSLWNATRTECIKVSKEQTEQGTKEIAKEIRSHIRKQFPGCKFSLTNPYYGRIDLEIKSSPYEKGSTYLNEIINYCNTLVEAYRVCYDAGDSYSDIPASYNFHFFKTSVDYDYTQTEASEEIKKDMADFDSKLASQKQSEEEKKEEEFRAWQKLREQQAIDNKKAEEEEKKQIDHIYNSVEVKPLEENKQYFVIGSEFADLNKNNTIDQYKAEIEKGKYSLENVKITKEVNFNNQEALTNFSNMLLNDFDFLAETGGSYTDDVRINSMTDFDMMDELERSSVQWNLYGVAVYFNNKLQFIVDSQGYNYARYVGLTDNAKIEKSFTYDQVVSNEELEALKHQADQLEDMSVSVIDELNILKTWNNENWTEYKAAFKNKLYDYKFKLTKSIIQQLEIEELKTAMYKVLQEVDGIQDQFEKADIQQGDKVTMFYISDWGSIVTSRMTFNSVENTKYAQYDNAVKITFTPERKRQLHYKYHYSTLLVYKGLHSLPDHVLNHIDENPNGIRTTRSKYSSCDHKQYDEILNHFEQQGLKPIVNTYNVKF